ncbi:MAG: transposase [Solirubrobacterales bacterium]|nr:transposase [Solirubrobacterales bacterium]
MPWARHGSRFTRAFEQQVAWLAVNTSKSAVAELMRIAWRSVGGICERVALEAGRDQDLLAGLRRIGIDEISHRKGHRYLTVVVDHDTGRLIWAASGRDKKTVEASGDRPPRGLAAVGAALSLAALREAGAHDHRAAGGNRRRDPPRPLQRPGGGDQHPDPADRTACLRVSLPRGLDLPGDAEARRVVSTSARPSHRYVTHGNVRRAAFGLSAKKPIFMTATGAMPRRGR